MATNNVETQLEGVELAAALEKALLGGKTNIAALKPYLIDRPMPKACVRGGFITDVVVYAKHRDTAFFVSLETGQFGVGTTNEYGDVISAHHYPTMTMALRAFVGLASR